MSFPSVTATSPPLFKPYASLVASSVTLHIQSISQSCLCLFCFKPALRVYLKHHLFPDLFLMCYLVLFLLVPFCSLFHGFPFICNVKRHTCPGPIDCPASCLKLCTLLAACQLTGILASPTCLRYSVSLRYRLLMEFPLHTSARLVFFQLILLVCFWPKFCCHIKALTG